MKIEKVKVAMIESEAGWGRKIDEIKEFDTQDEAVKFVTEYNKKYNNEPVTPSWYIKAELMDNMIRR
jgi:hypothetical protein